MMVYKLKKLKSFDRSVLDADANLYALSPNAADKFYNDYCKKVEQIKKNPYIFQVFEDDPYFRSVSLVYKYRLFYHIIEQDSIVVLHRIIHGAMDLPAQLALENKEHDE